jgi:hypothetical protein
MKAVSSSRPETTVNASAASAKENFCKLGRGSKRVTSISYIKMTNEVGQRTTALGPGFGHHIAAPFPATTVSLIRSKAQKHCRSLRGAIRRDQEGSLRFGGASGKAWNGSGTRKLPGNFLTHTGARARTRGESRKQAGRKPTARYENGRNLRVASRFPVRLRPPVLVAPPPKVFRLASRAARIKSQCAVTEKRQPTILCRPFPGRCRSLSACAGFWRSRLSQWQSGP